MADVPSSEVENDLCSSTPALAPFQGHLEETAERQGGAVWAFPSASLSF